MHAVKIKRANLRYHHVVVYTHTGQQQYKQTVTDPSYDEFGHRATYNFLTLEITDWLWT